MNKMKYLAFFSTVVLCTFLACRPAPKVPAAEDRPANPAAPGFNLAGSDARAIAVADSVMQAMGGREAWDDVRYLHWTFFGRRTLLWDKKENRVRISMHGDSTVYLLDMDEGTGAVKQDGRTLENPDSVAHYLDRAEAIWINDSYWLVMPFKLKDSGVTLTYQGRDTTQSGEPALVLQLTFEEVGRTPENKYHVLVAPAAYRVLEWRYFSKASSEEPDMVTPWKDYQSYDGILLSGDRGRAQLTNIAVYDSVPGPVFTSLEPVDASAFQ